METSLNSEYHCFYWQFAKFAIDLCNSYRHHLAAMVRENEVVREKSGILLRQS